MKWFPFVVVTALLGGLLSLAVVNWQTATSHSTKLTDNRAATLPKMTDSVPMPTPSSFNKTQVQPPGSQESAEPRFKHLDTLPLTALKTKIQNFWQQCTKRRDCEQWQAELAETVSAERYQLFAEYPGKLKQLEALMGSELIAQDSTLADKIAMVQAQRQQIFDYHQQFFARSD